MGTVAGTVAGNRVPTIIAARTGCTAGRALVVRLFDCLTCRYNLTAWLPMINRNVAPPGRGEPDDGAAARCVGCTGGCLRDAAAGGARLTTPAAGVMFGIPLLVLYAAAAWLPAPAAIGVMLVSAGIGVVLVRTIPWLAPVERLSAAVAPGDRPLRSPGRIGVTGPGSVTGSVTASEV